MRTILFLLLASAPALWAAEKKGPLTIRLHAEAGPQEGESFVTPVTLINPPKNTYIRRVPILSESDIAAFYPFQGKDGTIAAYFALDRDGTHKLEQHTTAYRDTIVVVMINGRAASVMRVDKKINDGVLYVAGGLLPQDILQMRARFPIIGVEKDFKEQKKTALQALKEQEKQEKAAAKTAKVTPTPAPKKKP